jgi:hypothetical protein
VPRKSAASLAVIHANAPTRQSPPSGLSKSELKLWQEIVNQMPADLFIVGRLRPS